MTEFEALYRSHAAGLYRFAYGLCGNRADAEDIVSETFVKAWTAPARIRAETAKSYLFTIARHVFLRRASRRRRQTSLDERLPDPSPGPDVRAHNAERARDVMSRLRGLPDIDRLALLLRAVEDMSYAEIAVVLNVSVPALKTRIHRARLRMTSGATSVLP